MQQSRNESQSVRHVSRVPSSVLHHNTRVLLHLHLGLCCLISDDGEIKSDIDDGDKEQEEESGHQQHGLHDH